MSKIGRNDPCPCGSSKKYKKCCLEKHENERGLGYRAGLEVQNAIEAGYRSLAAERFSTIAKNTVWNWGMPVLRIRLFINSGWNTAVDFFAYFQIRIQAFWKT